MKVKYPLLLLFKYLSIFRGYVAYQYFRTQKKNYKKMQIAHLNTRISMIYN